MSNELQTLLRLAEALTTTEPAAASPASELVGRRVLVRTRISGVSIGILEAVEHVGGQTVVRLGEGIRVWSWSDAFSVSEIATNGARVRFAAHPDAIVIADEGAEILPVLDAAWRRIVEDGEEGAQ